MSKSSKTESSGANVAPPKPVASKRRRRLFRLMAVAFGLLPFVVLELGLRAFDVGRPTEYLDPYVGFSNLHPQFELDEDAGRYVTTPSRGMFFNPQEFPAKKPPNGFRGFVLGGSTVRGRPYESQSAFAKWVEVELSAGDPKTQYQMVNCGGLSYASYRLTPMVKEVLKYEPDVIVIATGQNEFLEDRTYRDVKQRSAARRWVEERLYSLRTVTTARRWMDSFRDDDEEARPELPDRLKSRLDNASGYASYHWDEAWRRRVIDHYRRSLKIMIGLCREAGVPVVLVRLDANLRDCPPFKSEHKPGLSPEQELEWQDQFDQATRAESSDLKQSLSLYRAAEKIDDRYALLSFRIARVLDRLERYDEARRYYIRAKELDICPLRILEEMAADVKEVADETDTPLVDAREMFRSQSPQGIPGNNFFMDHVHPTIGGHQQIAQGIVEALQTRKQLPRTFQPCSQEERRAAYRRHFRRLGDSYFGSGSTRVRWVENWARRERLYMETLPVDIRGRIDYGHRWLDFGDEAAAWKEYWGALKDAPEVSYHLLLDHAARLFRQGRPRTAGEILRKLPVTTSADARRRLAYARLVVALELKDESTVQQVSSAAADAFDALAAKDPWRKLMPDALQRAERIAAPQSGRYSSGSQ